MSQELTLDDLTTLLLECQLEFKQPGSNKLLFCFDVDRSIVKGHLFNFILPFYHIFKEMSNQQAYDYIENKVDEFLEDRSKGWNNKEELLRLMTQILVKGNYIALTSFNPFEPVVEICIKKLGLPVEELEKIKIISYYPADANGRPENIKFCNKNTHVQEAMNYFGVTDKTHVVLIDDDIQNITAANLFGIKTIHVKNSEDTYIEEAFAILTDAPNDPNDEVLSLLGWEFSETYEK